MTIPDDLQPTYMARTDEGQLIRLYVEYMPAEYLHGPSGHMVWASIYEKDQKFPQRVYVKAEPGHARTVEAFRGVVLVPTRDVLFEELYMARICGRLLLGRILEHLDWGKKIEDYYYLDLYTNRTNKDE